MVIPKERNGHYLLLQQSSIPLEQLWPVLLAELLNEVEAPPVWVLTFVAEHPLHLICIVEEDQRLAAK